MQGPIRESAFWKLVASTYKMPVEGESARKKATVRISSKITTEYSDAMHPKRSAATGIVYKCIDIHQYDHFTKILSLSYASNFVTRRALLQAIN